jgi:glycosyltransferase involved in cell wall biosynthesis
MKQNVLIAIPAYNEEKYIGILLNQLEAYKNQALVVNDGSTDKTEQLIKESGFTYISNAINWGLTEFYKTSLEWAIKNGYTHMITLDSDGQHDPSFVEDFMEKVQKYDLVVGNRFTNLEPIPASKIASNLFAALLSRKIHGIILPDVACGFRGMRISTVFGGYRIEAFGVVYDMLFRFVKSGSNVGYVNIPAIYPPSDVYATKIDEIVSLLNVARQYINWLELEKILVKIIKKKDFKLRLFGHDFQAQYLDSKEYLFSTDLRKAKTYYDQFKTNPQFRHL